jgi:CRISPR/Cas system-associated exonuclease Cas4 (RecB family)
MFGECPRKWHYRYIQKIPEEQTNTIALRLGSAVHEVLELSLKAKMKGIEKYSDPASMYAAAFKQFDLEPESQAAVPDMMKHATMMGWFENYEYTELEISIRHPINDFFLGGRIDRRELNPGRTKIIDLKTGKYPYSIKDLEGNWQVKAYSLPFLEQGDVDVEFWFVRFPNKKPKITVLSLQKNQIEDSINAVVDEMKAEDGSNYKVNRFCKYCPFYDKCQKDR